ncbi:hypothetical protein GCM10027343_43580 [Noviherbaspirillum agri]
MHLIIVGSSHFAIMVDGRPLIKKNNWTPQRGVPQINSIDIVGGSGIEQVEVATTGNITPNAIG